jgi:hypothetical protein
MEGFKRLTGMGYCTLDIPFGRLRLIWLDLALGKNGHRWHFLWGHSKFGNRIKRKNRLVE